MGIFDKRNKEETKLEIFIRSISDKDISLYLISLYLKDIKEGRINNPFDNDEFLIEVVSNYCNLNNNDRNIFGSNVKEAMDNLNKFYCSLAPLKSQTKNIEKIKELFLSTITNQGKEHYTSFDKELYNLVSDKDTYTLIVNTILESETLIKNIDGIKSYILNNKEYLGSDSFESNILKVLNTVKQRGAFSKELQEELMIENKKRVGIYDVDQTTIAKIDDKLNGANSVIDTLKIQIEAAKVLSSLMDQKKAQALSSFEELVKILENKINGIVANANAGLSLAYNQYLQIEKAKLTSEKDEIIRGLIRSFEEKSGELRGLTQAISDSTTLEIQRVRTEGNAILEDIRSLMNDSPLLQEVISTYKENTELMDSIQEINSLSKEVNFRDIAKSIVEIKSVKGDIVLTSPNKQAEIIPSVSYYLDESKKYKERLKKLMDKKAEMIANGSIFHQAFDDVLTLTIEGANPYLWGPSGSGKTYLIKQIAQILEIPLYDLGKINESYDILGIANIKGEYSRPLFFQAYLSGGVALADELDAANPNAVIILNNFASGNTEYNFPYYGKVTRHPNFRLMTAGNTCGDGADSKYNGRFKVEESLQQRLISIEMKYDDSVDKKILSDYEDWFEFSQLFRKGIVETSKNESDGYDAGNFTTRDAMDIKKILDNQSLNTEKIMQYYFIQTKKPFYLNGINEFIVANEKNTRKQKTKELIRTFGSMVEEKCGNE